MGVRPTATPVATPALRELYAVLSVADERIRASAQKLRARSLGIRTIAERLREAGFDEESRRLRIEGAEVRDEAFELEQLHRRLSERLTENVATFAATFDDTKPIVVGAKKEDREGPR